MKGIAALWKGVRLARTSRTFPTIDRLCKIGLLVGMAGVVLLFRNLGGKPIAATLWGNDLDSYFIVWTVEWGYHTIFERLAPFDVWNANSYFPYPNSLAFSDSLLSAQLLYAPLRLLGFSPLLALYFTMAGFCIIGAVLTDRLLQSYSFTAGERALTVVAAHFSLPMTAFLIIHFQLFGMQLVPPCLLALHRLFNGWRGKDLILVTALFCLAGGFATYFVPMVGVVALLLLVIFSIRIILYQNVSKIFRTLGWKSLLLSVLMLALFCVIQLRPYLYLFGELQSQPMSETFVYSARPWSILMDPSSYSFWYKPRPMNYGYWERAAFPGLPLLLLAAVGGIVFLWRRPRIRLEREEKPIIPLATYAVSIFVICWVLSWGPYLQLCACGEDRINLPFLAFARFIPGVENIRAPGRFAQLYGLPLGLMAVLTVRWATVRFCPAGSIIGAVLAVVILMDQIPRIETYPFATAHADFFRAAKPLIEEGKPTIVLPIAGDNHMATFSTRLKQLESSTIHWAKLVTGTGSRDTPEQNELIALDVQLRAGTGSLAAVAAYARRLRIEKLVLFPDDYPPGVRPQLLAQADALGARTLLRNSEGLILLLGQ